MLDLEGATTTIVIQPVRVDDTTLLLIVADFDDINNTVNIATSLVKLDE